MLDFGVLLCLWGRSPPWSLRNTPEAGDSRGLLQEEEGKDDGDTLELYQQSLGELLLLLAGELGSGREVRGTSPMPW